MKSDKTTPNVPTLRFREFTDGWRLMPLKKLLCFQNGINADSDKYGKGVKFISVSDILNNQYITYDCIKGLIDIDEKTMEKFLVEYGDMLFQRSSETFEDIGRANVYLDKEHPATFGGFVIRGKKISEYNPLFFRYLLCTPNARKQTVRMGAGAQHYNIGQDGLGKISLYFPAIQEQQKIAAFLSAIDDRIAVQNKIISKYETLIKGIRHRVFVSICDGKQSVLGSFLEEYSEKNTANNLQSVAVGKYGIRKREDIYSKELSADYSKNKVIHKDTLIIGMGSTQIDIGILVTDNCYCVSPAYTTYRIKGINSFYLQEYLIELNPLLSIRYMITSARQGKAVNKEDLMKHLMPIHPEHEQIEICHCFEKLYSRLRIEKEMLSTLQRQKAFLLQSMFI